jgi:hypothetical protein
MAFLVDTALDSGLSWITTNGTRLDITSSEATTYAQATSTLTLGNDTVTTGSPTNGAIDGRKVAVGAVTAGSVTGTNTATHWALTNGASLLIATGALTAPQAVTNGNTFTLDAIDITIRDAT